MPIAHLRPLILLTRPISIKYDMLRNVEIKARVNDKQKIITLAKMLSGTEGEIIPQHDTFYQVHNGRLKLRRREGDGDPGTLIYYNRPDNDGPKLSEYHLLNLSEKQSTELDTILSKSAGVKGVLKKKRLLFMIGQTRLHIDSVEGLGEFMELEVVLQPDQTLEEGQSIAEKLKMELGVQDDDLLAGAYMDLVLKP